MVFFTAWVKLLHVALLGQGNKPDWSSLLYNLLLRFLTTYHFWIFTERNYKFYWVCWEKMKRICLECSKISGKWQISHGCNLTEGPWQRLTLGLAGTLDFSVLVGEAARLEVWLDLLPGKRLYLFSKTFASFHFWNWKNDRVLCWLS